MPKYHFNIYDGIDIMDVDGMQLDDHHAARVEAIRYAGAVIKDEGQRLALGQDWRMEVTTSSGLVLFRLDFSIAESAAIGLVKTGT